MATIRQIDLRSMRTRQPIIAHGGSAGLLRRFLQAVHHWSYGHNNIAPQTEEYAWLTSH
jgi:hypothetical protein